MYILYVKSQIKLLTGSNLLRIKVVNLFFRDQVLRL
jgi:hypothetical protein